MTACCQPSPRHTSPTSVGTRRPSRRHAPWPSSFTWERKRPAFSVTDAPAAAAAPRARPPRSSAPTPRGGGGGGVSIDEADDEDEEEDEEEEEEEEDDEDDDVVVVAVDAAEESSDDASDDGGDHCGGVHAGVAQTATGGVETAAPTSGAAAETACPGSGGVGADAAASLLDGAGAGAAVTAKTSAASAATAAFALAAAPRLCGIATALLSRPRAALAVPPLRLALLAGRPRDAVKVTSLGASLALSAAGEPPRTRPPPELAVLSLSTLCALASGTATAPTAESAESLRAFLRPRPAPRPRGARPRCRAAAVLGAAPPPRPRPRPALAPLLCVRPRAPAALPRPRRPLGAGAPVSLLAISSSLSPSPTSLLPFFACPAPPSRLLAAGRLADAPRVRPPAVTAPEDTFVACVRVLAAMLAATAAAAAMAAPRRVRWRGWEGAAVPSDSAAVGERARFRGLLTMAEGEISATARERRGGDAGDAEVASAAEGMSIERSRKGSKVVDVWPQFPQVTCGVEVGREGGRGRDDAALCPFSLPSRLENTPLLLPSLLWIYGYFDPSRVCLPSLYAPWLTLPPSHRASRTLLARRPWKRASRRARSGPSWVGPAASSRRRSSR